MKAPLLDVGSGSDVLLRGTAVDAVTHAGVFGLARGAVPRWRHRPTRPRPPVAAAGLPHTFVGDGSTWAEGCTGKHAQAACVKAGTNHFGGLLMKELTRPWVRVFPSVWEDVRCALWRLSTLLVGEDTGGCAPGLEPGRTSRSQPLGRAPASPLDQRVT